MIQIRKIAFFYCSAAMRFPHVETVVFLDEESTYGK